MTDATSNRSIATRALVLLLAFDGMALLSTGLLASWVGVRFSVWLDETGLLMLLALLYVVGLALLWDFGLIVGPRVAQILARRGLRPRWLTLDVTAFREKGFFSLGPWPLALVLVTTHAIIATSNITLISLELLSGVTEWRDSIIWIVEGATLEWIAQLPINVSFCDALYHSAWPIELFAMFVLIVITRRPAPILHFCTSFIVLFYLGRFIGLLNPVMGPAFFRPELFGYLDGSVTAQAMEAIAIILAADPSEVALNSALLGGVSALPSLHVGMVSLTVYWLAVSNPKTLFVGIPWLLAVWATTALLGWHYVMDGAAGILLAVVCIGITRRMLAHFGQGLPAADALIPRRWQFPGRISAV
jgi:hypothetical protein